MKAKTKAVCFSPFCSSHSQNCWFQQEAEAQLLYNFVRQCIPFQTAKTTGFQISCSGSASGEVQVFMRVRVWSLVDLQVPLTRLHIVSWYVSSMVRANVSFATGTYQIENDEQKDPRADLRLYAHSTRWSAEFMGFLMFKENRWRFITAPPYFEPAIPAVEKLEYVDGTVIVVHVCWHECKDRRVSHFDPDALLFTRPSSIAPMREHFSDVDGYVAFKRLWDAGQKYIK